MKSTPYTIHYGIGMLMNFEPLSYDTLKFEQDRAQVELLGSVIGDSRSVKSVLEQNEKLNSVVMRHITSFPLFEKVSKEPTDSYHFKITKTDEQNNYKLHVTCLNSTRLHITIEVEAGVRATINENIEGNAYLGYQLDLIVREGAQVDFISALKEPVQRTILRNAYVGKDAHIVWHEAVIEGGLIQSHTRTYLYESGARAEVKDLFVLSGETVLDMYHSMYHLASHTTSDMLTKGVLTHKARALYQGLIHIDEKAQGCVGYQKQDSLVLSNNAEVNAVPNLEIENSDVKCSHGVTTAHVDQEKLFYMQSRGMDAATATELFVEGHLAPCLDHIPDEEIKNKVLLRIKESLIEHRSP